MVNLNCCNEPHKWKFRKLGGFDQVCIERGADIKNLAQLDLKLWVVLNCPVKGNEFDIKTLQLFDSDNDGNIRAQDIIAVANWVCALIENPDVLINNNGSIRLLDINQNTDEGRKIYQSACQLLDNLGKNDSETISVDDTADTIKIFEKTKFNGDGIITVESASDANLKKIIEEIIQCCGSEIDKSGKPGISKDILEKFCAEIENYINWNIELEKKSANMWSFESMIKEYELFNKLKNKIDDYFIRCNLIDFDETAIAALNASAKVYEIFADKEVSKNLTALIDLPISVPLRLKTLNLKNKINPLWFDKIKEFYDIVIIPLFGEVEELNQEQWDTLKYRFSMFEELIESQPKTETAKLGLARINEILNSQFKQQIINLIEKDKECEPQANAISTVDKLLRYCRDLHPLLNNFVSFKDFYSLKNKAIFQAGVLYLDSKSCDLCVLVDDIAKHNALAALSRVLLVYCDCVRKNESKKITIAAAITSGDATQIIAGRNGLFYDRAGNEWNATVTKVIENPIDLKQAFWSPYRALGKMINNQIQKFAASREKANEEKMNAGVADTQAKLEKQGTTPIVAATDTKQQAVDIGKFVGIFAAISLAIGALGTALVAVLGGFLALKIWQMPLAVAGILLLISAPAMIMAWFKLRERNLAPILDSNGWAVNSRVKINIPFGSALTKVAILPENSEKSLIDPFAQKKSKMIYYVFILWIIALILYLYWKRVI